MTSRKVDFEQLEWDSPMPGVRHKVMVRGGQKLRLVEYSRRMEPHWCSVGHFGQILSGDFEITFDNGVEIIDAIFVRSVSGNPAAIIVDLSSMELRDGQYRLRGCRRDGGFPWPAAGLGDQLP